MTAQSTLPTARRSTSSWRVVDILVASVLGVAVGAIFIAWNTFGYAWYTAANNATPGLGGLFTGAWLLGGVLGGLVIRKPGAAIYVELLAALVSVVGSPWNISTLYSGVLQGLGAELIFALFLYRRFGLPTAVLAGMGAAVFEFLFEGVTGNFAKGMEYNVIYLVTMLISGAILAGAVAFFLTRGLASTGALDRFASGRQARAQV